MLSSFVVFYIRTPSHFGSAGDAPFARERRSLTTLTRLSTHLKHMPEGGEVTEVTLNFQHLAAEVDSEV
jgi:hypothetical protein